MANPFKFIGSFFKSVGKGLWKAIQKFLGSDEVQALLRTAQGKIVVGVVQELSEVSNLSSEQKRAEALKRIAEGSKNAGVEFKESVARLLLEIVVARLKAVA